MSDQVPACVGSDSDNISRDGVGRGLAGKECCRRSRDTDAHLQGMLVYKDSILTS